MEKRIIDIVLIIGSTFICYFTSTTRFDLDMYHEEWSGLQLIMYPAMVGALTVILYLLANSSKKIYNRNRWRIVGILCGINLLTGILLSIGLFG